MKICLAVTAAAFALLLAPLAWGQSSVIVRKPDNSGAVDVANTANQATGNASLSSIDGKVATSAKQDTGNTSLGSIDTRLSSQATAANQASQIAQETALNTVLGLQADAAWSASGSGTLIAIEKYIGAKVEASRALLAGTLTVQFVSPQAVTQSGTWNVTNISGTVSLPTGASTAANQATGNTSLATIATNTTGASTAAKQPALGVAGTPSSDVLTVQGAASMTALKVDGSAVTQPVSAAALPLPGGAATSAAQTTGNSSLATIATNTTGVSTAANQTSANTKLDQLHTDLIAATPAGTAIIGKVGIDQTTPGTTNAVSPQYGASGVTSTTCTITTATTCAAPTLIAGRDFHVSHKLTGFTGSCQWERRVDGTNWYIDTVTAGGSTTQMYNWAFSASTQNISEIVSESQSGLAQRLNCTAVSAGSDVVTISQ